SDVAKDYQQKFQEVLVDEYQDINHVQETIISLVSDDSSKGNRFMVGDVKQSIYRFRHADPTLSLEKYKRYAQSPELGKKRDYAKNLRSRENVLTSTNDVCRQILDKAVGELSYGSASELIYADTSYDDALLQNDKTELVLIDRDKEGYEEDEEKVE